jgi:hypothetical protein
MPDSTIPYKDHVEGEFGHVYKELKGITETLKEMGMIVNETHTHVNKINGRIFSLEKDRENNVDKRDCNAKCRDWEDVDKKITTLSTELEPVKTIIKYKKGSLVLLAVAVAAILIGAWGSVETFFQKQHAKDTNTELVEYKREVQMYQDQVMTKLNELDKKLK